MLPELTPELKQAMDLGISLFAGEAEGRLEEVLRDAWQGSLKPLYHYMTDLPSLDGVPMPILSATRIKRTGGKISTFDAGRGCPFQCSFCTIINVQGRKSRRGSADDVEQIVRRNLAQGVNRFFITDDNFARNTDWEKIFDRLIAMREQEKLNIKFVIQVDTMCHRLPNFITKAGRAGVARVFIGLENINPEKLVGSQEEAEQGCRVPQDAAGVEARRGHGLRGLHRWFPHLHAGSVLRDIKIIQRELPIDLLEPHCLTPLPGSEDHQKLHKAGVYLDPDLNNYNLEHVTTPHATMSAKTGVPPCRLRVRSFSILLIFSTWFISKSSWPSWSGATVASASSWRDPNARRYTDLALTPVSEQELDSPEMFTLSAAAKSPLIKVRQPGEARAATTSVNLSS